MKRIIVYVTMINMKTSRNQIRELFMKYGEITNLLMFYDHKL